MTSIISSFLIRRGFNKLRALLKNTVNQQELDAKSTVDFLFSDAAQLIQPWQFREEMLGLAKEIESLNAKVIVEIGTANGGTLFMATRLAQPDATIVSIDLPGGKFGGGYPEWKTPYYSAFARKTQQLFLIRGNSQEDATYERLVKILNGRKIDYLFIDGDHSYEGVKADYVRYKDLVRSGGKIGFHDVVDHKSSACKVDLFWNELKAQMPHTEYINDPDQGKYGIGLVTHA